MFFSKLGKNLGWMYCIIMYNFIFLKMKKSKRMFQINHEMIIFMYFFFHL